MNQREQPEFDAGYLGGLLEKAWEERLLYSRPTYIGISHDQMVVGDEMLDPTAHGNP